MNPPTPSTQQPWTEAHPANGSLTPTEALDVKKRPAPTALPRKKVQRRGRRLLMFLLVGLVLFGSVGGVVAWWYFNRLTATRQDLVIHKVQRESLSLTIVERGALESADNRDVVCRVKAKSQGSTVSSTIKWVIDDGTHVKQGDRLVELDDSGLQDQLKTQRIKVDQAENDYLQAKAKHTIEESQGLSDIKSAEVEVELAELDLEKYIGKLLPQSVAHGMALLATRPGHGALVALSALEGRNALGLQRETGEYEKQKNDIEGKILTARSDHELLLDRVAWSERMVTKKYFSATQALSDRLKLQNANISLTNAREELRILREFTYKRTFKDLESKVAEARRKLDRVRTQAESKIEQARSDVETKQKVYQQEAARFTDIEDEIRKCVIVSPQDGLVVYYVSEQSRFGSGSQQSIVAQGEPVREGQKLMRIPNLTKMLVNTKVHEAMVSRVRGDLTRPTGFTEVLRAAQTATLDPLQSLGNLAAFQEMRLNIADRYRDKENEVMRMGQRAKVRIDAFPEKLLDAHVKTVATVASAGDWMSTDVKVYQTMVAIDEALDGLKPGMSAEVRIYTDNQVESVITVPVQAVVVSPDLGDNRLIYVKKGDGTIEGREVVVGLSNDTMAEIRSGLEDGEEVVLNPKVLYPEKERIKVVTGGDQKPVYGKSAPVGEAGKDGKGESKGKAGDATKQGGGGASKQGGGASKGEGKGNRQGGGAGRQGGGAGGFGGDMTDEQREQMRKRQQEFQEKMKKATPQERKAMLEVIPEQFRDAARQRYKDQGMEIAD